MCKRQKQTHTHTYTERKSTRKNITCVQVPMKTTRWHQNIGAGVPRSCEPPLDVGAGRQIQAISPANGEVLAWISGFSSQAQRDNPMG